PPLLPPRRLRPARASPQSALRLRRTPRLANLAAVVSSSPAAAAAGPTAAPASPQAAARKGESAICAPPPPDSPLGQSRRSRLVQPRRSSSGAHRRSCLPAGCGPQGRVRNLRSASAGLPAWPISPQSSRPAPPQQQRGPPPLLPPRRLRPARASPQSALRLRRTPRLANLAAVVSSSPAAAAAGPTAAPASPQAAARKGESAICAPPPPDSPLGQSRRSRLVQPRRSSNGAHRRSCL